MEKHKDCIRGYHRMSKAWYFNNKENVEVSFGMYHPEGGISGELLMTWEILMHKMTPCLTSWDDSWDVLYLFQDVIKKLSEVDDEHITEEEFVSILDTCGFKDLTKYKRE